MPPSCTVPAAVALMALLATAAPLKGTPTQGAGEVRCDYRQKIECTSAGG